MRTVKRAPSHQPIPDVVIFSGDALIEFCKETGPHKEGAQREEQKDHADQGDQTSDLLPVPDLIVFKMSLPPFKVFCIQSIAYPIASREKWSRG